MINVLLSIVLFAAVKVIFLRMFAPKMQRIPRALGLLPESEKGASLMGEHDRRGKPVATLSPRSMEAVGSGTKGEPALWRINRATPL